jgi:predicted O-methyltransferase YrrM
LSDGCWKLANGSLNLCDASVYNGFPVTQSAAKIKALLRLVISNPAELADRATTFIESRLSESSSPPPDPPGLDSDAFMESCSEYFRVQMTEFLKEPEAVRIKDQIDKSRSSNPLWSSHNADDDLPSLCYAICRLLRPRVVIETGVANGVTSAFILQALSVNNEGHLWSIDLPPIASLQEVGTFIPGDLKEKRWTLLRGRTKRVLPQLLKSLPQVDLFLHDSAHTARNMAFEFKAVWSKLPPSGVLVSDDIHWNKVFESFIGSVNGFSVVGKRFGLAVKN